MLDRILVPLDGSDRAESVLARVRTLLHRRDGEVVLLRSVEFPKSLRTYDARLLQEGRAEAKRYLSDLQQRIVDEGGRARPVVVEGPPADAILAAARDEKADVIVMSTHGRSGIERFVLGSVTEKVVRGAEVPVLVLRSFVDGRAAQALEHPMKRLLVPLDGSDTSMAVLDAVAELSRLYLAEVRLLHVDEGAIYPVGAFSGAMGGVPVPPARPPEPVDPADLLKPARERLAQQGVPCTVLAATGDAASRILESAGRHHADLIAMATHGRSGLSRWVLGSVTEKVLRHATVPLLIVRAVPPAKARAG
jgi:nucleotide-binding universal stress UspA family protein